MNSRVCGLVMRLYNSQAGQKIIQVGHDCCSGCFGYGMDGGGVVVASGESFREALTLAKRSKDGTPQLNSLDDKFSAAGDAMEAKPKSRKVGDDEV
jgi:hypothetical protein